MQNKLKPCPFCGSEAAFIGESSSIKCKKCGGAFICTNPLIGPSQVAQAWNGRAANNEVKHGEWIKPYINGYGHPCHCCSLCGFKASYQDENYCPNCGAKMDGGDNA